VRPGGHVEPEKVEEQLPLAVEALKKAGKKVYMLTTNIVSAADPLSERIIKTASKLGVKFYRMGYLTYQDSSKIIPSLEKYRPQMKELADLNRQYTIHGAYQNHAGTRIGGPVWDLAYLLQELDPQFIGCQYDVRHATVEGGNSWILGMNLLAPMIKSTVIKDFKWIQNNDKWNAVSVPLKEGMVNWDKYWQVIKQQNIGGPLSLHYEYPILTKSEENSLKHTEKVQKFITVMKKDVDVLKAMMKEANITRP
jgi:sugar phosphate isomerase/epimerase